MQNKNRHTKKDFLFMLFLAAGTILFILLLTGRNQLYGSQIDWVSQHSVLPEYFRQQFYETGRILPDFAAHLGGGQNIFHFSYYGLLSPVILPSYLFPQLSMTSYIAGVSVILLLCSGSLCYYWLRQHCSIYVAMTAAFLFQFSAALLYHSHKQIMFVNYMPFLLLAFLGADHYFEHRKSGLFMAGIFLMIMTSYFYSIGGLLALTIYGIYLYCHLNSGFGIKCFLKSGSAFALRILIPAGMAAFLLLPSLASIFSGRSTEAAKPVLSVLFVPQLNLLNLLYSPYGIGLTAISILSVFRLFTRNRAGERTLFFLLAGLFTVPLFLYLLNGGLYLRGKVFIPFLPLLILITALYLEELWEHCQKRDTQLTKSIFQTPTAIYTGVFCLLLLALDKSYVWLFFLSECALVTTGLYLGIKKQRFLFCCLPSCLVCLCICTAVNFSDPLVEKSQANTIYSEEKQKLLESLSSNLQPDWRFNDLSETESSWNLAYPGLCRTSIYSSTYDADYNNFHMNGIGNANGADNNITCRDSNNILFQTFMGVKYLISNHTAPAGYHITEQNGPYQLYENNDVFPLGWGNCALMSRNEFDTLSKPDQNIALLNYIIVDDAPEIGYTSPLKEETLKLPFLQTQDGSHYRIELKEDTSLTYPLEQPLNDRLMLLSFSFEEEPEKDIVVSANKIVNRLTGRHEMYPNHNLDFQYVISENNPVSQLKLDFSAGSYQCSAPKLYSLDYSEIRRAVKAVSPLSSTGLHTGKTVLDGVITMAEDGYFTASIPYDRGFQALVDGKPQEIELVNTAFLGFPLSAGIHKIELIYQTPLLREGIFLSKIFLLLFLAILILEQRNYALQSLHGLVKSMTRSKTARLE